MQPNKSPRLNDVCHGAQSMMRYLEQMPAFLPGHDPIEDIDTIEQLERSREIAARLGDLVAWTHSHHILARKRYQEYCRLRNDFEILTGAPSWFPIFGEDSQSSFKNDSTTLNLSAIQSNPVTNLQVAVVCLSFDLVVCWSQLRKSDRQTKQEELTHGLEDILDWIGTSPECLTEDRLRQYQRLRHQYEDLTRWLEHPTIIHYFPDVDDIIKTRVSVNTWHIT